LPRHTAEIFRKGQESNLKFKVYNIETGSEARKRAFYISWDNYKKNNVSFRMEK
jgi:hypothetical protein